MSDPQGGSLKPVTPARVVEELVKLSTQQKSGDLTADEFEHRFARMVGELRDRRIEGNRSEILTALAPLVANGTVPKSSVDRLTRQLGIV